jgi:shikimate kinase
VNVVLLGLRASGKSIVGGLLAQRLGFVFVDTDDLVTRNAGCPIRDIFEREGGRSFRRRESAAVREAAQGDRRVIALGGGALLSEANRTTLRANSFFVWLRAAPETLVRRVREDPTSPAGRPNLTPTGGLEEILRVSAEREAIFQQVADTRIDTDRLSPRQVAAEIERRLGRWKGRRGATS